MTDYISPKRIQGVGPIGAEILIVGEAPYGDAEHNSFPIDRDALAQLEKAYPGNLSAVRYMNLSEYKPTNNDFSYLDGSTELRDSIGVLESYITQYPPKLIIGLGERVLRHFSGNYNINDWRGSPLSHKGIKFLPTYTPDSIVYNRSNFPIFSFDLQKALDYLQGKNRIYKDNFTITHDQMEMMNLEAEILAAPYVTIDIETKRVQNAGEPINILCIGFGLSAERAICMVLTNDSARQVAGNILCKISKPIFHNSLFDVAVLRYFNDVRVLPAYFDTLLAAHVLDPEMPRGLDFICSTLTWRPCYWSGISFNETDKSHSEKQLSTRNLYIYNCFDVVVTYEAYESQQKDLEANPRLRQVFDYEMEMLEVSHHMSSTGFTVDETRRALLFTSIEAKKQKDYVFLCALAGKGVLITSPKQVKDFLYGDLELPPRRTRKGVITTDNDALVGLIAFAQGERAKLRTEEAKGKWSLKIAILKIILNIRGYEKLLSSYLGASYSKDGRLRSIFKVAGTESGRLAGGNWWDETGLNAQTLPREEIEVD